MARRSLWAGVVPALAAAALLLIPSTSQAWGHRWGGWGWGGWYGPHYSSYGRPAWVGYPHFSSYGWTTPVYRYYGAYPYHTSYYYPSYPTYTYPSSANSRNDAQVRVEVPANAKVWFSGHKTNQTGTDRLFYTPPLDPKANYRYQVRARWTENGQVMDRTRDVPVRAGQTVTVDFTRTEAVNQTTPVAGTVAPRGDTPTSTGP